MVVKEKRGNWDWKGEGVYFIGDFQRAERGSEPNQAQQKGGTGSLGAWKRCNADSRREGEKGRGENRWRGGDGAADQSWKRIAN